MECRAQDSRWVLNESSRESQCIVARERGKTSDDAARYAAVHVEASREHAQK
jgi:hypothetical protein